MDMESNDAEYELVVIGGGIYGIMLALEASLRDVRVAVVERNEWGSGTTSAWLRILHGGLRYLQSADLPRFYESVRERRWFLQHFPDLMAPLPCVMPLYRRYSYPRLLMRAAMGMNDALSMHRNRGVADNVRIPSGTILSKADVVNTLPFVETDGLTGGARWHDAVVLEPQTLLLELLKWASSKGATALDHTEAVRLLRDDDRVLGVEVRDLRSGGMRQLRSPVVINATGHWAPGLAEQLGSGIKATPRFSWAWNLLFDVTNDLGSAAAVSARRANSQTFFMLPWRGQTLIGTGHALMPAGERQDIVPENLISEFIQQVAEAVPALNLTESKVARIYQGVLPAGHGDEMQLTTRPLIVNHGDSGLQGLYTVWGIKFTTARDIAKVMLRKAFPSLRNVPVTYKRPM